MDNTRADCEIIEGTDLKFLTTLLCNLLNTNVYRVEPWTFSNWSNAACNAINNITDCWNLQGVQIGMCRKSTKTRKTPWCFSLEPCAKQLTSHPISTPATNANSEKKKKTLTFRALE